MVLSQYVQYHTLFICHHLHYILWKIFLSPVGAFMLALTRIRTHFWQWSLIQYDLLVLIRISMNRRRVNPKVEWSLLKPGTSSSSCCSMQLLHEHDEDDEDQLSWASWSIWKLEHGNKPGIYKCSWSEFNWPSKFLDVNPNRNKTILLVNMLKGTMFVP